jgi:uncharacterized protein (TIGR02118 family)
MMDESNAIVLFFGHPDDPAAFYDHLMNRHMPIASRVPGVTGIIRASGLASPDGTPSQHFLIVYILFANPTDLMAAFNSEESQAATADLENFATGGYTFALARVESGS